MAIVAGVTGSRRRPETVLLGRFDPAGRLRYLGRTNTLTDHQAAELAQRIVTPAARRGGGVHHPWPRPLPAGWSAQFGADPLAYLQVQPTVVVEVAVDAAYEHHRWRPSSRIAHVRDTSLPPALRDDMSLYEVPS